jgi:branched-chain amino acid transport system ATP-binding protein
MLSLNNIEVVYDGVILVLKGVSLQVKAGSITTVLGANGAGKSSLLKALQGTVRPAGGRVRFKGRDVTGWSAPRRVAEGLVLVPEGRQIFVSLTVHENLLMGAYTRQDEIGRELDAIYRRFPNLAERRHMPASVLSGGEQQMLAIGRALLAKPALMMLDEPSLGLSPLLVVSLFELIAALNRDGLAILLVEQNTKMALETAARGYVLELGKTVLEGPTAALRDDPNLAKAYLGAG